MKNHNGKKDAIPENAPFGTTIVWGRKGVGKTLACLNSPWRPVHVIDTEFSSKDYALNQAKLIEMGVLVGEFTRSECMDLDTTFRALKEMRGTEWGTIIIDTGGQWSEWVADLEHSRVPNSEKVAQLVWGKIRSRLRSYLIEMSGMCKCLLLTAHERKYIKNPLPDPRCNPALLEIASNSIRLTRGPNQRIPDAEFYASRIPFFPPRIQEFSIAKMLTYFDNPTDWKNLEDENKIPPEPVYEEEEE